ncbi:hypothetical protein BGZ61DRAFT_562607 [Ilyonectria robusta]|uniref:uncharacterized protein n=1 Tax=Ilyonectria robusta TaxID=1079257 RepID=UPI001E8D67F1|nr:uncharacterized protein BGZ61DRAFT_562607 [Ilyonectria robusta]KAH8663355.1 hypothetical protein BGZ61DRAFT_562607 [Ilyonectria robusta]
MKLSIFTVIAQASLGLALVRRDLGRKNVEVAEVKGTQQKVDYENQEIVFADPASDFEDVFRCSKRLGKQLTFNVDKTFVACCGVGQVLLGSPQTAFDCCGSGLDLVGDTSTGFACCASSETYDGSKCKPKVKVCANGKVLDAANEECVCPSGTAEASDGGCLATCSSGVSAGKCYVFAWENGYRFGYNDRGWYSAAKDGRNHRFGKFQLCKDQTCSASGDINPNDAFRIMDIHGQANSGQNANQWLNDAKDFGNIGKTSDYSRAGVFTITKWACGRYCLGGFAAGLGPSYPSDEASAMFTSLDNQACIPIDITEVPCDIHSVQNNCITHNASVPCLLGNNMDRGSCDGSISGGSGGGTAVSNQTKSPPTPDGCDPSANVKPIKDGATRADPCKGDTSYNEDDFPCSKGKEKPCRGAQVKGWTAATLPWGGAYVQPGPPKPHEMWVEYDFPVVMSIVDVEAQSEHFLLKLDDKFLGETGGENGYKNEYVGQYWDAEWCLTNGYTRGYFRIPAGRHKITIEWPQGTGKYKTNAGGAWWYGIAKYRFDRLCDSSQCT